jgi:hypothetical protein
VIVDKLEKLPRDKVEQELAALGVTSEATDGECIPQDCTAVAVMIGHILNAIVD